MNHDIRKFALRLKLIEILGCLTGLRRQPQILQRWKKAPISPNGRGCSGRSSPPPLRSGLW